jgi:EAL domain-containing protein (putative c-di-GMP-specific phosphodiesterase class I)
MGLISQIEKNLADTNINPNNIELEVTESLLLDDSLNLRETLAELKNIGIQISIDDFGTGYSNLAYLKKIDVNTLKIDRSFIQYINEEKHNKNIVKAIIEISKSLEVKVVAEGVETQAVADSLKAMNCEIGNGYFWSKPLNEDEFIAYLKQYDTGPTNKKTLPSRVS